MSDPTQERINALRKKLESQQVGVVGIGTGLAKQVYADIVLVDFDREIDGVTGFGGLPDRQAWINYRDVKKVED